MAVQLVVTVSCGFGVFRFFAENFHNRFFLWLVIEGSCLPFRVKHWVYLINFLFSVLIIIDTFNNSYLVEMNVCSVHCLSESLTSCIYHFFYWKTKRTYMHGSIADFPLYFLSIVQVKKLDTLSSFSVSLFLFILCFFFLLTLKQVDKYWIN